MPERDQLNRSLTLLPLVFYGVGTMIGAGIYSVIGAAATEAGHALWLSFVLAGIAAFLTVLSYAELASMVPAAGAEYQFLKAAFPGRPLFSFMAGYLIALNAAATTATVSLAFGGYLGGFVDVPVFVAAFGLLAVCTLVNIVGIRESTWVGIGLICIEVAGLLLVVWSGIDAPAGPRASPPASAPFDAAGVFAATALIFFVFIGFEDVANLSEETREPKRDIPRALIVSVLVTTVLYIAVALAVTSLGDPATLGDSMSPLADLAATAAPWRGRAVGIAALFATASTALILLVAISRLLFGMAREGDMPRPLARTWAARKTPWVAALALAGAAGLLLPLGEVKVLASISSFGVILVFIAVHASMIGLRFTRPDERRGFRVPFAIGRVPVLPVLSIAILLALLTRFEPVVYLVGGGIAAAGVAVHFLRRR